MIFLRQGVAVVLHEDKEVACNKSSQITTCHQPSTQIILGRWLRHFNQTSQFRMTMLGSMNNIFFVFLASILYHFSRTKSTSQRSRNKIWVFPKIRGGTPQNGW